MHAERGYVLYGTTAPPGSSSDRFGHWLAAPAPRDRSQMNSWLASAKLPVAATALACLWAFTECGTPSDGDPRFDGPTNAQQHIDAPYVVLVSFDGFAWDLMEKHSAPNFERVAAEGVRAERMIPTFPTKTFPAHYSIATGMYAERVYRDYWPTPSRTISAMPLSINGLHRRGEQQPASARWSVSVI